MKSIARQYLLFFFGVALTLYFSCTPKTTAPIAKAGEEAPAVVEKTVEAAPVELPRETNATIPVDPAIRMGTLDNGLKYYIRHNSKPENRAELRLAVNAGSMQEDDNQVGLAHFVEHMAFNGSRNFEKSELVDYLESVGTRFGPDLNAYTSFDETVYMLQARTDSIELLKKGLLILEDWAGGVSFDGEEIDKERGVVISEWRSNLSPDQRMQQKTFPVMYKNSRYAERLPIGKPEIIENANYETVRRFYKDWYRPNLMAVAVVGDFDVDMMEKEIVSRFSKLGNPVPQRPRDNYEVPKHDETLISIVSDKEAPFTRVQLMYKHDHIPVKTVGDYRSSLIRSLYNGMLNARLDELTQSADPPFTFSYSGYSRDVGNLDTYNSYAFVAEGGAPRGLEAVLTENKRVLLHGFLQSELERQKTEMLVAAERAFKEKDKTESGRLVMSYVYNFLDENPIPNPEQRLEIYKNYLPTITLEEVNKLAQNWITDKNRVVVITGPEKEETPLPTEEKVLTILKKVDEMAVIPYEDNVSDEPLLAEKLSPVSITNEKKIDPVDVTELTLANGVTVILKPTTFKNDEILMRAYSEGGTSLYPDEDYPSASNAASIIDESGIGNFDLTQLQKLLTGKTVGISPFISELYEGMNGSASPDDLETLFQLVYLYFTAPRKDPQALQSFVTKQKSIYQNVLSNPQYYFINEVSKIKYQNSVRRVFPTVADFDKISLDRVFEIYKDRFADASDFTFIFVGNFEVEKLKPLLATYLGNLPGINREEKWKNLGINYPDGKIEKELKKGKAPKSLIDIEFHGNFEWEAKNRYTFGSLIQLLKIKMRESMREDKGGVYGVRVNGGNRQIPEEKYNINISFESDPANVEELIKTAMQDIKNVQEGGAEEKDLNKIKETQRQSRIKDLKENRFWLGQLNAYYQNDLDPSLITLKNLEKYIESLNSDDLKQAANRYFDMNRMIKVVMDPEEEVEN